MPFQSEKQRRYLWANEPEIARDWTDTYGSGIAKALGGRIGYNRGRVVNPGGYAGELSGSELFLKLYQEGKIDNLQYAMEDADRYDAGEKTNYEKLTGKDPLEIYQKYTSDQPEIFSETLQEGLDKSNTQQKQKRSREQELLDEMNQTKGTIEFDPNNVQINKASMIPEGWIENLKSLWGGEPTTPTGIMKAGTPFMDPTDANYIPRETMANWSQFDDAESEWNAAQGFEDSDEEAAYADYASGLPTLKNQWNMPNWKMPNLSNVGNLASGAYTALKGSVPWTWGAQALNFIGGRNRGPVINRPTQNFMNQYNVGRDPITGRMTSGPFAGRNLPGTSLLGSKTPQQMAQNWMSKYGSMDYNTERQIAKQKEIRDIAAGNLSLPPSERTVTPTITPRHAPHHDRGGNGGNVTPASLGMSRDPTEGSPFDRGGLAGLWPR